MKQNKKITTKSSVSKTNQTKHNVHPAVCDDCSDTAIVSKEMQMMTNDTRNAVLIVSVFINLFVFTTWLVMQHSSVYAAQVAHFLAK